MGETTEEFDATDFEQRLSNLKDTQDSIQAMSAWCLKNRSNHKKVVSSWLSVLKQVKVEHRLTLFHLANDVIQYSKRKNYEFVDSWGTTLQRATTMVRDEKVKNKIIRIFNIWEQRGIYNEEFLADLHGLLSINPSKKQQVESDDEQASIISSNIRNCVRLEKETDRTFRSLSKTPLCDTENFHTLKDRRHVEDVEREIDEHACKLDNYIKALNAEIKARTILIAVLEQTDAFYHNQRGEVKVVANAYRNFGNRIKVMKRKVDELCMKLPSPIPSPDINAPSPEPDDELPLNFDQRFIDKKSNGFLGALEAGKLPFDINDFKTESPRGDAQPIQVISSQTVSSKDLTDFNIDEFFKSILPDNSSSYTPSTPQPVPPVSDYYNTSPQHPNYPSPLRPYAPSQNSYGNPSNTPNQYNTISSNNRYNHPQSQNVPPYRSHTPQQHAPRPPFNAPNNRFISPSRPPRYPSNNSMNYRPHSSHIPHQPQPSPFDGNLSDEYNPESWDIDMSWTSNSNTTYNSSTIETPVSPPHFDQAGISTDTIEYIDQSDEILTSAADVDHRQLRLSNVSLKALTKDKGRAVDVDHRNLISLTGSPIPKAAKNLIWKSDVDFRQILPTGLPPIVSVKTNEPFGQFDADYRILQPPPNLGDKKSNSKEDFLGMLTKTSEENNKQLFGGAQNIPGLTPPRDSGGGDDSLGAEIVEDEEVQCVEAPIKGSHHHKKGRHNDNVETIDMEMSDDEFADFDEMFIETKDDINAVFELNDELDTETAEVAKSQQNIPLNSQQFSKPPPSVLQPNYSSDTNDEQQEQHQQHHQHQQQHEQSSLSDHIGNQNSQQAFNQGSMFNSPPPNFNANQMAPNFGQQQHPRFWNPNNGNPNFTQRPWNIPPNVRGVGVNLMNRMMPPRGGGPHNMRMNFSGNQYNSPRFTAGGQFNQGPTGCGPGGMNSNYNISGGPLGTNQRGFNPSQNINNMTSPHTVDRLAPQQQQQQQQQQQLQNRTLFDSYSQDLEQDYDQIDSSSQKLSNQRHKRKWQGNKGRTVSENCGVDNDQLSQTNQDSIVEASDDQLNNDRNDENIDDQCKEENWDNDEGNENEEENLLLKDDEIPEIESEIVCETVSENSVIRTSNPGDNEESETNSDEKEAPQLTPPVARKPNPFSQPPRPLLDDSFGQQNLFNQIPSNSPMFGNQMQNIPRGVLITGNASAGLFSGSGINLPNFRHPQMRGGGNTNGPIGNPSSPYFRQNSGSNEANSIRGFPVAGGRGGGPGLGPGGGRMIRGNGNRNHRNGGNSGNDGNIRGNGFRGRGVNRNSGQSGGLNAGGGFRGNFRGKW